MAKLGHEPAARLMEIVELDERAVREHVAALAQLLFDERAANMALSLVAPLTQHRAETALSSSPRAGTG